MDLIVTDTHTHTHTHTRPITHDDSGKMTE